MILAMNNDLIPDKEKERDDLRSSLTLTDRRVERAHSLGLSGLKAGHKLGHSRSITWTTTPGIKLGSR